MSKGMASFFLKGKEMYSYHRSINSKSRWHPAASKFYPPVAKVIAEQAIREGDAMRSLIRKIEKSGRRILECKI